MENLEIQKTEQEVLVIKSICNECKGIVSTAVKHLLTGKRLEKFYSNAAKDNCSIDTDTLENFKKQEHEYCDCQEL